MKAAERRELLFSGKRILSKVLKNNKTLIGLDPGSQVCGICIEGNTDKTIKAKGTFLERIAFVHNELNSLFSQYKKKPLVFMEDYAWAANKVSQMSELGGVIKLSFFIHNVKYVTISPATLKKFALGPNPKSSKKENVIGAVAYKYKRLFSTSDECDAFCLYQLSMLLKSYINNKGDLTKWEQKLCEDIIVSRIKPGLLTKYNK